MTTHAESINSDLQRGLDRRLRHTTLNTEQNHLVIKVSADNRNASSYVLIVEFLQIQIPTDRTSGTRTRATQMLTNTFVEICSTTLTSVPRRLKSDFRKGDSCASQLLAVVYNIYKHLDSNPSLNTMAVFLYMSKAFDKVWHEGLLFKLKIYGIEGKLLAFWKDYLHDRKQSVTIAGKTSSWRGVRQVFHRALYWDLFNF